MSIIEQILETAHRQFWYREAGEPAAPAIILLHSMGPDATVWDPVAKALSDRFHVFALHQRGFGPGKRPGNYTFELMRDDVLAFADALRLEQFILVGHSMGGTVAYLVAEKSPERVVKLVIEDTPPPWGGDMPDPPDVPPEPVAFDWEVWRSISKQLKYPDPRWWDELPEIACPTLIIGGGSTSHVPQELLVRVANLIPNARLVSVDGAGHNIHTDRLDEFMTALHGFLSP